MTFAASISEHPVPATAVGEVVGDLMEKLGEGADLVCVFVSPQHAGALEDIAAAVQTLLRPKVLIGCAGQAIIGPGVEVENGPAISLWGGNVGPVSPVRLEVVDGPTGGKAIGGWPIDLDWVPAGAIVLADPFSFPVTALFDVLNKAGGFPRVNGGMASAGKGPGGNRLVLDGTEVESGAVFTNGAVGVLISASDQVWLEPVVSQGCRPIGRPFTVTRAEGNVIFELGGQPALERLTKMVSDELSPDDMGVAQNGLLVGIVVDEHLDDFGPGDFLIRTLLDADPLEGSLSIGQKVEVGTTIQFHIRDAVAADGEMATLLFDREAEGVLLFSGTGRGTALFEDEPDHDAALVADLLDRPATAGFFANGEFGPIAGKNLVHGFSASMALFSKPPADAVVAEEPESPEATPNGL